jgi:hypothetical protein
MSDEAFHANLGQTSQHDDGIGVRFPPGLGLIPPRDVPHPRVKVGRPAVVA